MLKCQKRFQLTVEAHTEFGYLKLLPGNVIQNLFHLISVFGSVRVCVRVCVHVFVCVCMRMRLGVTHTSPRLPR